MKARLYRGPSDGKVLVVRNDEKWVVIQSLKDPAICQSTDLDLNIGTFHYRRTKHTHPDGSTYFEWDQPKGTRSGVRAKRPRKRKNQPMQQVGWTTGTGIASNTITTGQLYISTNPYSLSTP